MYAVENECHALFSLSWMSVALITDTKEQDERIDRKAVRE